MQRRGLHSPDGLQGVPWERQPQQQAPRAPAPAQQRRNPWSRSISRYHPRRHPHSPGMEEPRDPQALRGRRSLGLGCPWHGPGRAALGLACRGERVVCHSKLPTRKLSTGKARGHMSTCHLPDMGLTWLGAPRNQRQREKGEVATQGLSGGPAQRPWPPAVPLGHRIPEC